MSVKTRRVASVSTLHATLSSAFRKTTKGTCNGRDLRNGMHAGTIGTGEHAQCNATRTSNSFVQCTLGVCARNKK